METNSSFPRTRYERLALKDKTLRERQLLWNRPGLAAKMYRENAPLTSNGLTEPIPQAAGYIDNCDRFHSDTSGEEFQLRMKAAKRKNLITEAKRKEGLERDEQRWERLDQSTKEEDEYWCNERSKGIKGRKNFSQVPYNAITLKYNDGLDGDRLRYEDDMIRYRAARRAEYMTKYGGSRCGYDILSGQDTNKRQLPPAPLISPALKTWMTQTNGKFHIS